MNAEFLGGVIEGFYGEPWTAGERVQLFGWMAEWGLNTYLYAPKDDLKHRVIWREVYTPEEAAGLRELTAACQERGIRFIYAIGPGLDIRYSSESELQNLQRRFEQMIELGCLDFAVLFDDIPDAMEPDDAAKFRSFATAQCHVANELFRWLQVRGVKGKYLFCPTAYCGRMRALKLGGEGYLETIGRELLPEIEVFWTGPEIISETIEVAHVRELQIVLRRKPVIWDNLHANDYDGRRFYCGPYAGRPLELRQEVNGILSNPNNEFALNYVPVTTLAEYLRANQEWNARSQYLLAMGEWEREFQTVGKEITVADLVPFGDCYYLPHQEGEDAEELFLLISKVVSASGTPDSTIASALLEKIGRLKEFCWRVTGLRNRPLFYALSRRVWELREELDLLEKYVRWRLEAGGGGGEFRSDFHLPRTYRGGFVARLQALLQQGVNGTFGAKR